ncbi:hypothetical protein D3C80_2241870 [compost metagenome]
MPLLAQVGRYDNENAAAALGPALGNDQTRFNGFTQAYFVGEDHAFGQGIPAGE